MAKDKLGARMKSQYEHRTRSYLPRRTYTLIRIDGKAFHTFTKGFDRPHDKDLTTLMNETIKYLCQNIQGCKLGYVQSDEISLLLTDFEKPQTDAYFDGNIQKITSISASMATMAFNRSLTALYDIYVSEGNDQLLSKLSHKDNTLKSALFDSRVFTIPDRVEVGNYFVWRQQDATKNSISMLAQSQFSHKELYGVNTSQMQYKLMLEKDINWNDCDEGFKRGRVCVKKKLETGRTKWEVEAAPIFTKDEFNFIKSHVPKLGDYDENN